MALPQEVGSNPFGDFDISMIMKLKSIMDAMNSKKDDPRCNLLLSLKPYLKDSRKDKVDQYIKIFNMSNVMGVMNDSDGMNLFDFFGKSKSSGDK